MLAGKRKKHKLEPNNIKFGPKIANETSMFGRKMNTNEQNRQVSFKNHKDTTGVV